MPATLVEKVLADNVYSGRLAPAELVQVRVDRVVVNDGCGPLAFEQFGRMGAASVADPEQVVLVNDHFAPAPTLAAARSLALMREFARQHRIGHFFDVGAGGIEHALLPERGLVAPGDLIVGGDSHTCTLGAFAAIGVGVGATDIAAILALGRTWIVVPPTRRVDVVGERPPLVTGKDLALALLAQWGQHGAADQVVEFDGPGLAQFNVDDRMALCNMVAEAGAVTAVVVPDEVTRAWAATHGFAPGPGPDRGAEYLARQRLDVATLTPMVARPPSPADGVPLAEVAGVKVDHVYIGNCANGTISDLRQAARVIAGRTVAKHVRLIVVPATQAIYRQAIAEGLLDIFVAANGVVATPGCGACFGGHLGLVHAGEVVVANINRNYRGRMGHPRAEIFLANSYVAAAAAVAGEIVDPTGLVSALGGDR